jgi:hypothetical protein
MIEQPVMIKNTLTNHRLLCITLLPLLRLDKGHQQRTCREISAIFLCLWLFELRYLATGARQRAVSKVGLRLESHKLWKKVITAEVVGW